MVPRAPEHTGPERRQRRRRDDDIAEHEIIEHAVHDAPIVNRILRSGKIAAAMLAIGGVTGSATTYIGTRATEKQREQELTVQVAKNSTRIDSLASILRDITYNLRADAYARCLQSHRDSPTTCIP